MSSTRLTAIGRITPDAAVELVQFITAANTQDLATKAGAMILRLIVSIKKLSCVQIQQWTIICLVCGRPAS